MRLGKATAIGVLFYRCALGLFPDGPRSDLLKDVGITTEPVVVKFTFLVCNL